jgi:hypothetical protein
MIRRRTRDTPTHQRRTELTLKVGVHPFSCVSPFEYPRRDPTRRDTLSYPHTRDKSNLRVLYSRGVCVLVQESDEMNRTRTFVLFYL